MSSDESDDEMDVDASEEETPDTPESEEEPSNDAVPMKVCNFLLWVLNHKV